MATGNSFGVFEVLRAQGAKTRDILLEIGNLLERSVENKAKSAAEKATSKFRDFHQVVKQVSESLKAMGTVASIAGIISAGAIQRMVGVANPAAIYQLDIAFRSLSGVLGQMFLPVVQTVTGAIREVATWLYNLSPATKAVIAAVAAASVAAVAAIGAITTGIIVLNAALTLLNVLSGGWVAALGLVATALVGATAALAGVGTYAAYFGHSFAGVKDVLYQAWGAIKVVFSSLWSAVKPVLDAVWGAVKDFVTKIKPSFDAIKDAVAGVAATFDALRATTDGMADALRAGLGTAVEWAAGLVNALVQNIEQLIDTLNKLVITVSVIKAAIDAGYGANLDLIKKAITHQLELYEQNKKRHRQAIDNEPKLERKPAPVFDQNFHFQDIAEAKKEFMLASLRASAGLQSPEEKQANLLEQGNQINREQNGLLRQLIEAYNLAPRGMRA